MSEEKLLHEGEGSNVNNLHIKYASYQIKTLGRTDQRSNKNCSQYMLDNTVDIYNTVQYIISYLIFPHIPLIYPTSSVLGDSLALVSVSVLGKG